MLEIPLSIMAGIFGLFSAGADLDMRCSMHINFEDSVGQKYWRAVNDNVMGGKSSGEPSFTSDRMVFSGVLNTDGGGFSSVRRLIPKGSLENVSGLILRLKPDGRAYKISLRTDALNKGRPVSFQAPIPHSKPQVWADVFVPFDTIEASVFGRPVDGIDFVANDATSMGLIIADGKDGPFRLEITRIETCPL